MASPSCDGNKNIIITGRLTPPVIGMSLVCGSGVDFVAYKSTKLSDKICIRAMAWHFAFAGDNSPTSPQRYTQAAIG